MVAVFNRTICLNITDMMMVNNGNDLRFLYMIDRLVNSTVVNQCKLSAIVVSGMIPLDCSYYIPLVIQYRIGTHS